MTGFCSTSVKTGYIFAPDYNYPVEYIQMMVFLIYGPYISTVTVRVRVD